MDVFVCNTDADCEAGQLCLDGKCTIIVETCPKCPPGEECVNLGRGRQSYFQCRPPMCSPVQPCRPPSVCMYNRCVTPKKDCRNHVDCEAPQWCRNERCIEIPCNYQGALPCQEGICRVGRCMPPCGKHCQPYEECNRNTQRCMPKERPTRQPPGDCLEECPEGQACNRQTRRCERPTSAKPPRECPEECPEGEICNKKRGRCEKPEVPCDPPCRKGQFCNLSTGKCQSKPYLTTESPDDTTKGTFDCPEPCPYGQECNQEKGLCQPTEEATTMAWPDTTTLPKGKVCYPPCETKERCVLGICIPYKCECDSNEECNSDKVCVQKEYPPPPPACPRLCNPRTEYCNSMTRTCVKIIGCPMCPEPLVCDPGRKHLLIP